MAEHDSGRLNDFFFEQRTCQLGVISKLGAIVSVRYGCSRTLALVRYVNGSYRIVNSSIENTGGTLPPYAMCATGPRPGRWTLLANVYKLNDIQYVRVNTVRCTQFLS